MKQRCQRMMLWGSLFLFSSGPVMAGDLAPVNEPGQFAAQQNGLRVPVRESPNLQMAEMTGTLSAVDQIFEGISVRGPNGMTLEFALEPNTPITEHNLQIGLTDLHPGDHVTVHYNIAPRRLNSIERI